MKKMSFASGAAMLAVAVLLAGCGGGGGGGGGGVFLPVLPVSTPAPAPAPSGDTSLAISLSGVVTYDSVPNTTGALAYGAVAVKPVRGVAIEVVNSAGTVLASAATDAAGHYAVTVPSNTAVFVRAKAQLLQTVGSATWDASVRDNTQSNALYVLDSPSFSTGAAALTRDLHAASGWGGTAYTGQRVAAPFAVLDTVYVAMQKVISVAPATAFPKLELFWSINNVPTSGNRALGQIGTTSFVSTGDTRSIYVLGKADVDTDEYDASVIAHEWGHYYQAVFSRDDSPGGSHAASQRVDRRLAFSEGWGNAWSGIALARANYTDSLGAGQGQGSNIDLAAGAGSNPGWFRESSVQSVLWNLEKQAGFAPIHAALTGPFRTTTAVTSIHAFAAAFGSVSPGNVSALAALLSGQGISGVTNDAFGAAETNAGGAPAIASALPLYVQATVGTTTQACVSNLAGTVNKLGSYVYLRVNVAAAGSRQISVTGPSNADPDFEVYSGRLLAASNGLGASESSAVGLLAGDNVIVVRDYNDSAASTCFNVTIN